MVILGAASSSGRGECFVRTNFCKRVADNIALGKTPDEALLASFDYMTRRVGGDGGGVALSKEGEVGVQWNTRRLAWAYIKDGILHQGCYPGEDNQEKLEI